MMIIKTYYSIIIPISLFHAVASSSNPQRKKAHGGAVKGTRVVVLILWYFKPFNPFRPQKTRAMWRMFIWQDFIG